ncbi:PASTA domain-containing protein, partial [Ornithinicoccus halotolerans]|uniref:PASTA domain-containing protein n=1 Tax=Ornithinicoccus halotolerans TaxID=1748220 RepID=UPI0012958FD8
CSWSRLGTQGVIWVVASHRPQASWSARRGGDDGNPLDGYEETDEIPVREQRHRGGWLLLGLLALLALAGVGWVMFQVLGPGQGGDEPEMVAVPEVVGVTEQVAERRLQERGLEIASERVVHEQAEGTVVGQDPPPEEQVEVGSTVRIEVSSGPDDVTIPNVIGFRQQAARVVLEQANLTVADEVEEEHDPEFDAGRVTRTDPETGQAVDPQQTVVTLVVASGQVEVPELVELDAAEAIAELQANRLSHGDEITYVETSEVPANQVLEQSVEPGAVVDYGTEVQLTVSREPTQTVTTPAPPPETVTAPPEDPEPTDDEDDATEGPEPTGDEDEETEDPPGDEGDPTEQP